MGASMTRVGGALAPIVVGFVVAAGMGAVSVFYLMTIPVVLGLCAAILIRKPKFDNQ
jgi:fucose permease